MTREFSRTQRVADFLKRELASLIQQQIRDPRVGLVSVTDVEVSRDLSHAKVYITVLGSDNADQASECIEVLNQASGFLRSLVAKSNAARTTPKLRFYFDNSIGRGQYMSHLIDEAIAVDKQRAATRENTGE